VIGVNGLESEGVPAHNNFGFALAAPKPFPERMRRDRLIRDFSISWRMYTPDMNMDF
jgi:hypothetical protein